MVVGARVGELEFPDVGDLDPQVEIRVRRTDALPSRVMFQKLPWGSVPNHAPVCVDANCPDTQYQGLVKRLGRVLPALDDTFLRECETTVNQLFERYPEEFAPLTFIQSVDQWLSQCSSYNEARKRELRLIAETLDPLQPDPHILKRFAKVKSFIKVEDYPSVKHARWINSRVDHFKVFWGPACKQIEQQVYRLKYFIKHVPVVSRPSVIDKLFTAGAKYVSTDYSAFESQFRFEVMDHIEFVLYRRMLSNFPEYARIVCDVLGGDNLLSTSYWRVKVPARRMSGDMNTSLGNGFTNLVLWATMARLCGISWEDWDGFVEGDDGIFAIPDRHIWTPEEWAARGFILKLSYVSQPGLASFCGVVSPDGVNTIRDPFAFLAKFGWSSTMIGCGTKVSWGLLRAKSLSVLYETPNCPIVSVLARAALARCPQDIEARFTYDGYHTPPPSDFNVPAFRPTTRLRCCFEELYHISVDLQLSLERSIESGDLNTLSDLLSTSAASNTVLGTELLDTVAASVMSTSFLIYRDGSSSADYCPTRGSACHA